MAEHDFNKELKQIIVDCAELLSQSEGLPNSSSLQNLRQLFTRGLKLVSKIERHQTSTSFFEDFMSNLSDFSSPSSPEPFLSSNPRRILSFDSGSNSPAHGSFFDEASHVSTLESFYSTCSHNDTSTESFHTVLKHLGLDSDEDESILNGEYIMGRFIPSQKRRAIDDICETPNKRCQDLLQTAVNPSISLKLDNGIVASKLSRIDDPGVVSAIVAGEKHVYFATNDFVVRKFDYTSKTEKTIYKDDQEVSVRKLMLSSDEKTLVAVTHRNEIIFLNAEDENPSDDSVQKVKVSHPIIDCRWNEPFGLILLLAHSEQPLCLLNDGNFLYFPSIGLENEYPVAISDVIERRMIVVSNTRNVMVLEFDEKLSYLNKFEATTPLAVVAADAVKAVDNEANKSSRLNRFIENSRLGPQWALLPKDAEDAAKATTGTRQVRTRSQERRLSTGQQDEPIFGRQRIFLCGTQPAAPPTQVPYVIKRYGRT